MAHASKMFDFIMYADDTTMSTTIEILITHTTNLTVNVIINKELLMVNNCLKLNKLSLNIKKRKYMIFHTKKKNVESYNLKIDDVIINDEDNSKDKINSSKSANRTPKCVNNGKRLCDGDAKLLRSK